VGPGGEWAGSAFDMGGAQQPPVRENQDGLREGGHCWGEVSGVAP
jgi:hypothetical protein